MTGSMPGMAASTSDTWLFGLAPKPVDEPENSLDWLLTCACTSSPMTISQSPVAPFSRLLGAGFLVAEGDLAAVVMAGSGRRGCVADRLAQPGCGSNERVRTGSLTPSPAGRTSAGMRHFIRSPNGDAHMSTPVPDYTAIKQRQQATWATGDYAIVGSTLQIVGERLCEAVDLRAGERVLDVAAGNGNATLAAARHFAEVTSTDYVPALLERGRERAAAERLVVKFQQADAEALPFADGSFDLALSTFGVMFTPNQEQAAAELTRVVRNGGRIGLANWTPEGFIGQVFKTIGRHVPPPAGIKSPALWGTEARLAELFPGQQVKATRQIFHFRYKSAAHWLDVFKTYYGPANRAFAALETPAKQAALQADLVELLIRMNRGGKDTLIVPSEYLEVVVTKRA